MEEDSKKYSYCFVLGAGASCDFGYPTGLKLIKRISVRLQNPTEDLILKLLESDNVVEVVGHRQSREVKLEKLCKNLGTRIYFSGISSIDRFLSINIHNDAYQDICKYLIIDEIRKAEYKSCDQSLDINCFRWDKNWYRSFFGHFFVEDSIENLISRLEEKPLAFIIFNYDRLLEYFLITSLVNLYDINPQEDKTLVDNIFSNIKIEHVYGRYDDEESYIGFLLEKYGAENPETDVGLIQNINTIRQNNTIKESYCDIVENSTEVCFLGFSFDSMNLSSLINEKSYKKNNKFSATRYGLSDKVINDVNNVFGVSDGRPHMKWFENPEGKIYDFILSKFGS